MDENLNQNVQGIDAEELKNETKEVISQVKENMKNVDIKEEAEATKGFIKELLKNPLGKINEIANDKSNKFFKTSIVLVIIWTVIELVSGLDTLFSGWGKWYQNILDFIKGGVSPIVSILTTSLILFWLNHKQKKSLTTYITTIATVKLPIIVANLVGLLTLISYKALIVTTIVYTYAELISTVLLFFAIKSLTNEENEKNAFRKFAIFEAIWIAASFLISLLDIGIL